MEDWIRIAEDIERNYNFYDAFIILHGTDTMAYTASALSFMLENLSKPIILTGSQVPILVSPITPIESFHRISCGKSSSIFSVNCFSEINLCF